MNISIYEAQLQVMKQDWTSKLGVFGAEDKMHSLMYELRMSIPKATKTCRLKRSSDEMKQKRNGHIWKELLK